MGYDDLTDEDKIEEAIKFIALDQPLPEKLKGFLIEAGLYEQIVNPQEV